MKKRWWLLIVVLILVVPLHIAGNSTRSRVMLLGLERRYGKGGEVDPVYIEGGPQVLTGITAIGNQPVEIVSRGNLMTRYAGQEAAPELTTVTVSEEHDLLGLRYKVTVSSFSLQLPGAKSWPWGGTHYYFYRQWGGLLWADGEGSLQH